MSEVYENKHVEYSSIQTVRAEHFQAGSYPGFVILQVIDADTVQREMVQKAFRNDQSGYPHTACVEKAFVIKSPLFLIGKPIGTVEAELRSEVSVLQEKLHQAEMNAVAKEKEILELKKQAEKDYATIKEFDRSRDTYQKDYQTERDRNKKLEADIGRIRTAIGDLQMQKILEDAT